MVQTFGGPPAGQALAVPSLWTGRCGPGPAIAANRVRSSFPVKATELRKRSCRIDAGSSYAKGPALFAFNLSCAGFQQGATSDFSESYSAAGCDACCR